MLEKGKVESSSFAIHIVVYIKKVQRETKVEMRRTERHLTDKIKIFLMENWNYLAITFIFLWSMEKLKPCRKQHLFYFRKFLLLLRDLCFPVRYFVFIFAERTKCSATCTKNVLKNLINFHSGAAVRRFPSK